MADPGIRLNRLLDLLPRIYTADVQGSAIGTVLRTMAASLTRLDDDTTRVLHDRWIVLASGWRRADADEAAFRDFASRSLGADAANAGAGSDMGSSLAALRADASQMPDAPARAERLASLDVLDGMAVTWQADQGEPSALERLGQLVGVPRLLPRAAPPEPIEDYRHRIRITAHALSRGLATPRAILSLAIADLGQEPCPRMQDIASETMAAAQLWAADATVAWGMKPGTVRRCAVCSGGGGDVCPNRDNRTVDAWITENPVQGLSHHAPKLAPWQDVTVTSSSLISDRPGLSLCVLKGRLEFPALQNRATGEIMLLAGTLRENEELQIDPGLLPPEIAPFEDYDKTPHHDWLSAFPQGRAQVVDHATNAVRDVSDLVYFIYGSRFIDPATSSFDSVFDATYFSDITRCVRTPQVRHGQDTWRVMSMPNPAAEFDADTSRYAGADDAGTRFAKWDSEITDLGAAAQNLFAELVAAEKERVTAGVQVDLRLRWFTRPPYTARLRVLRTVAVEAAEARGAVDLLLDDVAQARAAGVRLLVDFFRQTGWRDEHTVSDSMTMRARAGWRETAVAGEGALALESGLTLRETGTVDDRPLRFGGRLDVTRFDSSLLAGQQDAQGQDGPGQDGPGQDAQGRNGQGGNA